MSADTAAKRYSAINIASPWRGLNVVPDALIPAGERAAALFLYSGIAATPPATTAAITGTILGATEADIRAGGKTIIITLSNDTWVSAGASFDAQRQNIIDGLDSAQLEALGWDAVVKAGLSVTAVARTGNAVVTITLPAFPTYDITANETITATIPASALTTSLVAVVGVPPFAITYIAVTDGTPGGVGKGRRRSVKLSDFADQNARNRASEFIKAQLALDKKRAEALQQRPAKPSRKNAAKAAIADEAQALAMRNMEIEAAEAQLLIENNNRLMLILLSS